LIIKVREHPKIVPDTLLDSVAYIHGAIDPDSGHMVCHHYPLGVALLEVDGESVPALSIGECIYLAPHPWSSKIASSGVKADIMEVGEEYTIVGGVRVETQSISLILSTLREDRMSISFYIIKVDLRGKGVVDSVAASVKGGGGEWIFILTPCTRTKLHEGEGMYY